MMKDSISRFSRRAKNYDLFRPNYPLELIAFLAEFVASIPEPVLADIAAGTGIFTEQLADWGHSIYVVEPNKAMRRIAIQRLAAYPRCIFVDGTAEATGLPDQSVDFILSAQAFHWFDLAQTKTEFARIGREHAFVAIVWNLRNTDSAFEAAYETLIRTYAADYMNVSQRKIDTADVFAFFAPALPEYRVFEHVDFLTFEQLCGRTRSYSFMPDETSTVLNELLDSLAVLFAGHQQEGKVRLSYKTRLFIGRLG
ncbi:class I SAM-dependent methyltransferase [Parapedobacter koreensis]|uniref:Methyltransferase domain-containing protein n=1 Tax=Parapedobacter koreensis TaxID=332977 RepID=A0A1H7S5V1_9SPHI|nr:class I SAM-dependent methyltransferase [Parapedobacter koreensis]SEL67982.1 Methyltransferase domain-containing protein [Parapedobacter koreensis]